MKTAYKKNPPSVNPVFLKKPKENARSLHMAHYHVRAFGFNFRVYATHMQMLALFRQLAEITKDVRSVA